MAKKMFIGMDGKARKIKKVFIGMDGKARKVRKMYLGVDGKARCIYSGGLAYYGTAAELYGSCGSPAATTVGSHALFAGGKGQGYGNSSATAFDSALTRTAAPSLCESRHALAAATVGNCAIFAGGYRYAVSTQESYANIVDIYDSSLTKIAKETYLSEGRHALAAASIGNHAIFAGGYGYLGYSWYVDIFDAALTRTSSFITKKSGLAATTVGEHAIFAGGIDENSRYSATVVAFDESLTRTAGPDLSVARGGLAAASTGGHALFGGGCMKDASNNTQGSAAVDVFDESLTRTAGPDLSVARCDLAATGVDGNAVFAGGLRYQQPYGPVATVDIYDSSLTRTVPESELSKARDCLAATTVGDRALFGGGNLNEYNFYSTVDVYTA